jgi:hypothetical protein
MRKRGKATRNWAYENRKMTVGIRMKGVKYGTDF